MLYPYGGKHGKPPWEDIPLDDYESHVSLGSIMRFRAMNEMMKDQLSVYPASAAMILGIAGGNGLEHVRPDSFKTLYYVDINPSYLHSVARRYPQLANTLTCLCLDLATDVASCPHADLLWPCACARQGAGCAEPPLPAKWPQSACFIRSSI